MKILINSLILLSAALFFCNAAHAGATVSDEIMPTCKTKQAYYQKKANVPGTSLEAAQNKIAQDKQTVDTAQQVFDESTAAFKQVQDNLSYTNTYLDAYKAWAEQWGKDSVSDGTKQAAAMVDAAWQTLVHKEIVAFYSCYYSDYANCVRDASSKVVAAHDNLMEQSKNLEQHVYTDQQNLKKEQALLAQDQKTLQYVTYYTNISNTLKLNIRKNEALSSLKKAKTIVKDCENAKKYGTGED